MPDSDDIRNHSTTLASLVKLETGVGVDGSGEPGIDHYLYEHYAGTGQSHRHRVYYHVKRFLPRSTQLSLRRLYAKVQARKSFPAWPIEESVVRILENCLKGAVKESGGSPVHRLSPWPDRNRFAFAITHDVEGVAGLRNARALAELERDLGFNSSWNIVPERYPIDWKIVDALRSEGFEIGVHGLKHDGRLFDSYEVFSSRVEKINRYAKEWGAVGFRSPSTLRNAEWMPELAFEYDSSFPDTDPYEPQAGGCCSIWPFFIGNLVELPLTMPQDHTLFEILGYRDISVWQIKADWIENNSGLVLIDVHPDYMLSKDRLRLYRELLLYMKDKAHCWHVLPREIARWWRQRDASELRAGGGSLVIEGPAAGRASIIRVGSGAGGAIREQVLE